MAEIIQFKDHKHQTSQGNYKIIKKLVDGECVDCVNLDMLTPAELATYFADSARERGN